MIYLDLDRPSKDACQLKVELDGEEEEVKDFEEEVQDEEEVKDGEGRRRRRMRRRWCRMRRWKNST